MRDSEQILKSMNNPIDVVQVEGEDGVGEQARATKRRTGQNANAGARFNANVAPLQLNPNNFDWFLSGIDQTRLEGILGGGAQKNTGGHYTQNLMKNEDTFLMVRDGAGQVNDILLPFGDAAMAGNDILAEGSAFRNAPGEASAFADALRDNNFD